MYKNSDAAFYETIKKIENIFSSRYEMKYPNTKTKHRIFYPKKESKPIIYAVYKHEPFKSFGKVFKESKLLRNNPYLAGFGESVNQVVLEYCKEYKINYIVIIYEDEKMYMINPLTWLNIAKEHGLFRQQNKVNKTTPFPNINAQKEEWTYSIPLKLLKPLEA